MTREPEDRQTNQRRPRMAEPTTGQGKASGEQRQASAEQRQAPADQPVTPAPKRREPDPVIESVPSKMPYQSRTQPPTRAASQGAPTAPPNATPAPKPAESPNATPAPMPAATPTTPAAPTSAAEPMVTVKASPAELQRPAAEPQRPAAEPQRPTAESPPARAVQHTQTLRELLARVDDAWVHFHAAAGAFPSERMDERLSDGGWTRKQMLAHIAAWHDLAHDRLGKLINTGKSTPLTESDDAINARVARQAVGRSAGEVLKEMEMTFNRLRRQLARLTDEQLEADDGWAAFVIARNTYEHYDEHWADMRPISRA